MELIQRSFMKGTRRFVLPGDGTIHCEHRNGWSYYQFVVELRNFDQNPRQDRYFAVAMFVGTLLFGILTIAMLFGVILSESESDAKILFSVFLVLFSLPTIMCLIGLLRQTYQWLVFVNSANINDSIVLFTDKPNREQFQQFVDILKKEIIKAKAIK